MKESYICQSSSRLIESVKFFDKLSWYHVRGKYLLSLSLSLSIYIYIYKRKMLEIRNQIQLLLRTILSVNIHTRYYKTNLSFT